jgi:leucyl aminopeptidase
MKICVQRSLKAKKGLLVFPLFQKELKKLPQNTPFFIEDFIKQLKKEDFKAKRGELKSTYLDIKNTPEKLAVLGLGEMEKIKARHARELGAKIGKQLKANKKDTLSIFLNKNLENFLQELLEGVFMSQYEFTRFKSKKKKDKPYELKEINLITNTKEKQLIDQIKRADLISEAVDYVKDLVNAPSNEVDAAYFVKEARKIKSENNYKIVVLGQKELQKMGWGGLLAVNQGSAKDAKCIVIEYDGGKRKEKPIAIVGKGLIFDTGGYNLKPTRYIETMQQDMAGGAAVMGLFKLLKKLKVKKNVIGIIPLTENLVNENAYRPSDIIKTFSGQTVEVTNTDAEGRLILCDGVTYATKLKPEMILTIATLTGAVSVALGNRYAGLMGNNHAIRNALKKAGQAVDDLGWPLPVHNDFKKKLDSKVADMMNCNIGVRGAGAQEGASFLERFVEKNKWCHIDIGGTGFTEDPQEYESKGATASGVRMLLEFLEG